MDFNQSQVDAIKINQGPALVLAGPGSGKTLVITRRTQNLIEECGIDPGKILVISFTRASAEEMKRRFNKLTGSSYPVTFGTFHSVFFRILKLAYGLTGENILKEEKKTEILRELVEKRNLVIEDVSDFLVDIGREISLVKNDRLSLENYYAKSCSEEEFKYLYRAYEKRLEEERVLDFDDMLVKCYELLVARPDILGAWQRKYTYILIDEFQDINKIQYDIIAMLAKPENNLFVVGDDDQSIYRFRGARPEIMKQFKKDYPKAKEILLGVNYRSTKNIVETAGRLIAYNKNRFEKKITTPNKAGEEVRVLNFSKTEEENQFVIDCIRSLYEKGHAYQDIAILFRTNIGPRSIVERLLEYNLPFKLRDSMPNIYEHWIARDFITYIRLAMGSDARGDFYRIMNKPKRYFHRNCLSRPNFSFEELRARYADKDWMVDRVDQLECDLNFLKGISPYAAITYIRKSIGYDNYLKEYADFRRMEVEELQDVCEELADAARPYKDYESWFAHIRDYSRQLKEQSEKRNQREDGLSILTMHGAKGLEYPVVFIMDAQEGITPHSRATLDESIEEERRLFYVAMTRAKEQLFILSAKERFHKEMSISRFVGELLYAPGEFKKGREVEHRRYGKGTIETFEDGKIQVHFSKIKKTLTFDCKFVLANGIIKLK